MVPSTFFCTKCGGQNELGATVCFACGEDLAEQPTLVRGAGSSTLFISTQLLKERYRLRAQIGEGGFGAVYRAEDSQLGNRSVAVKEMRPASLTPQEVKEATEAFHREASLLAGLNHPSLPHIYEHFSENGRWYLVMEYIEGKTLEAHQAKAPNGRLSVRESFQIALQLCNVLDYLHNRVPPIIFRDLKPSNVMLTPTGQVYLIDFGIARLFKPGQNKDTMAFGSPGYAAPEQYGKAQTTPRSDVFSLGALLHHMLTGDDPSNTPFRFAALLMPRPTGTWTFIRQMVDIDEQKRPPSMAVVRHTLQRLADTWEADRRAGPPTSALPGYQAATGFLPAVVSGQRQPTSQMPPTLAPTMAQAATPAPPKVYPGQVKPPMPPSNWNKRTTMTIVGVTLAIVACIGLIAAISALANRQPDPPPSYSPENNYPTNYYPTATLTSSVAGLDGPAPMVAWSPDGKYLASGGIGDTVQVWDAATGSLLASYTQHTDTVAALAWSPDSKTLASAGADRTVRVWNPATGATLFTSQEHRGRVSALAWSPDGKRLAASSDDQTVQVLDGTSGTVLLTEVDSSAVWTVAWSPDGKYLASGDSSGAAQVWDAATGTLLFTYGHASGVDDLVWSPDGTRVASASLDNSVQVWDALTGKNALVYDAQNQPVLAVAWSPDGKYIASGGADDTVQVWDAKTGVTLLTYHGHHDSVWSLAWSPDGKRIASAGADRTMQVWDVLTGNMIHFYPLR